MNEATETSPLLLVRSNDELGVTGMSEYQRLAEIEAQLELADTALQAAIGNMGKLAGSSRWIGSFVRLRGGLKITDAALAIDIMEKLDEMADICEYWKKNRERGYTPNAIRSALLMISDELALLRAADNMPPEILDTYRQKITG